MFPGSWRAAFHLATALEQAGLRDPALAATHTARERLANDRSVDGQQRARHEGMIREAEQRLSRGQ